MYSLRVSDMTNLTRLVCLPHGTKARGLTQGVAAVFNSV